MLVLDEDHTFAEPDSPLPASAGKRNNAVRFLIVDDHDAFRLILCQMVESNPNWSVVAEARDGCEAVRMAQTCLPDVVLMDVVMPVMNGIEATNRIHQLAPKSHVILLSAYHEEEFLLSAIQAGAIRLIWKDQLNENSLEDIVTSCFPTASSA